MRGHVVKWLATGGTSLDEAHGVPQPANVPALFRA